MIVIFLQFPFTVVVYLIGIVVYLVLFSKIYVYRRKIQKEEEILGNQQPLCLIAIDENSLSLLSVIVSTIPIHFRTTSGPFPIRY